MKCRVPALLNLTALFPLVETPVRREPPEALHVRDCVQAGRRRGKFYVHEAQWQRRHSKGFHTRSMPPAGSHAALPMHWVSSSQT